MFHCKTLQNLPNWDFWFENIPTIWQPWFQAKLYLGPLHLGFYSVEGRDWSQFKRKKTYKILRPFNTAHKIPIEILAGHPGQSTICKE
jgi:hypothetical protein